MCMHCAGLHLSPQGILRAALLLHLTAILLKISPGVMLSSTAVQDTMSEPVPWAPQDTTLGVLQTPRVILCNPGLVMLTLGVELLSLGVVVSVLLHMAEEISAEIAQQADLLSIFSRQGAPLHHSSLCQSLQTVGSSLRHGQEASRRSMAASKRLTDSHAGLKRKEMQPLCCMLSKVAIHADATSPCMGSALGWRSFE